jgi:G:T-mismatch repair DNA endonuclease (very short patch repair protein)
MRDQAAVSALRRRNFAVAVVWECQAVKQSALVKRLLPILEKSKTHR